MVNRRYDLEKAQLWRLRIDQQQRSGLNVREFCRREAVSEPSFYAWRRELTKRDATDPQSANQAVAHSRTVIPVEVVDPPQIHLPADLHAAQLAATSCVELVTPGGCLLRFTPDIEPASLRSLLEVIAGHESDARTEPSAC